jgi:tRNA threonylcarbamoyladenosine biosynthesis protein TsaE
LKTAGELPRFVEALLVQTLNIDLRDLSATERFGCRLGELLFPGAVVGLIGPLGAGKTHLVRAVSEGLGIADSRTVSSPTFVLIQEYVARVPIYHFDAYRLRSPAEFFELGVREYFDGEGICLIEWADKVESLLPSERLSITLAVTGETHRQATLLAMGSRYEDVISTLS